MSKKLITTRITIFTFFFSALTFFSTGASQANYTTTLSLNSVALSGATVSSTPALVPLPSDNIVDMTDSVKVSISGLAAGSTVAVSTSNCSILSSVSTNLNTVRSTDGISSANINVGTGTTAEFYVYSKSTSLGSFTIASGGTSNTYYIKGASAGPAYNVDVSVGTNNYTSTVATIPIKVTDIFGNPVIGSIPLVTAIGMAVTTPAATDATGTTATTVTYPSTPGRGALQVSVSATAVVGLPAAKNLFATFVDIVSLSDLLAAEKSARAKEKSDLDAALAAEKAARAKDKTDSEAALAAAQKAAADALAAEKNARTKEKSDLDASLLAAQKAGAEAIAAKSALESQITTLTKANQDIAKQLLTLQATIKSLENKYKSIVSKYNSLAKKFKQPTIKP